MAAHRSASGAAPVLLRASPLRLRSLFESINIPASNEHFDTTSLATIWALGHAADRADVAPLPWS